MPRSGKPGLAFSFTLLLTVCVALLFPSLFLTWGSFDCRRLITPLLQLIMFTMGTRVSLVDLRQVFSSPGPVAIGLGLQYLIMPFTGAALASAFALPPDISAGVVLTGSVCAGNSSNVMTWFAGGNLALSMAMTTLSTLLAPLTTPFLMKLLASRSVPVDLAALSWSIVKIVVIPVICGLLCERLLRRHKQQAERFLPIVVITATCLVNAIITAVSREALLATGLLLIMIAVVHNLIGYVLGYAGGRLFGLKERESTTMAMQVGIRNCGLAAGLAYDVLHSTNAAIPSVLFGTVQNASGALIASYFRKRLEIPGETS